MVTVSAFFGGLLMPLSYQLVLSILQLDNHELGITLPVCRNGGNGSAESSRTKIRSFIWANDFVVFMSALLAGSGFLEGAVLGMGSKGVCSTSTALALWRMLQASITIVTVWAVWAGSRRSDEKCLCKWWGFLVLAALVMFIRAVCCTYYSFGDLQFWFHWVAYSLIFALACLFLLLLSTAVLYRPLTEIYSLHGRFHGRGR